MNKIIIILVLMTSSVAFSQVGIGTQTPSAKSILDLTATDKGFLLPRLTTTERTAISPNATSDNGMQVYDTTTKSIWFWNGITWVEFGASGLGDTTDDAFINNFTNTRVELGSNSDGSVRTDGSEFVIKDNGFVGIGTNNPNNSAALDIQSNSKGLLPPRMTKEERDGIVSPASGLVLYCTDCNSGEGCLVFNYGTPAVPLWECVGQPKGAIVSVDCAGSSINGNYVKDVANTAANTVTIKVDNNTFSSITANFTNRLTLSGAVPGLTVTGPTPAQPVTIAAGSSQILTYTITGTPTASGSFTARFSGNGLECVKNGTILASAVIPDCENAFVYGLTPLKYLKQNTTYTGGKIRIPYTTTQNIAFSAQTITLPSGLTLTRSAGTFTVPSGFVEYTIGGTYVGSDCSSVTANLVLHSNQSCNVTIGEGHSSYLSGVYTSSSSSGYGDACPATQTAMTDNSYSTGWASPGTAANQFIEITFPQMALKQVVLSGGAIPCWGGNAQYVSAYANVAGLQLEYWNGSAWVGIGAVPALTQASNTIVEIPCNAVTTSRIRVRNATAQWWGLGTFYPVGYWDSKVTPPTLDCSNAIVALTPNNALVNGQAYTGTVTINYTSTLEAGFGSETVSRSGLTLTRDAGTMVNGSGSITYNVSGTYMGSSFGTQSIPISLMGGSCNVVLGNPTPFKTGTYTSTSTGYNGSCPATQTAMTDNNYSTGWASPNTAASQWIEINLGTSRQVKSIVASGGPIPCWGGNAQYVSAYANVAGLVFEAWNGTNWVSMTSVNNNLTQNSLTTYNLNTPLTTSRIRVRNNSAQWWGLGTFYPFVF